MRVLERYKQERIARQKTKEYIESINPKSRNEKIKDFLIELYRHKFFYLILIPAIVLLLIFA